MCWLWPYRETQRKVARTFAQQVRLMDLYPEYKFIQSQPETYQICKELYPELYEKIKEKIKAGQWIADGSMWVEPDTNMTSGESLIRQIMHGKKFYKDEFGVDCQLLWLPDKSSAVTRTQPEGTNSLARSSLTVDLALLT